MPNMFDSDNYPTIEPLTLVVGDRWAWKRTDIYSDYPPATYSLEYHFVKEGDPNTKLQITAGESGNDYVVEVASSVTSGYTPGRYKWNAFIIRTADSERIKIGAGSVEFLEDYENTQVDPRSFWRQVLDNIEPIVLGKAKKEHSSYSYKGRAVNLMSPAEIWDIYNRAVYEVKKEEAAENVSRGLPSRRKINVRFINRT